MPERLPLPRLAAGAILLLLPPLMGGRALAQDCPGADGRAGAVVARLVSVEGRVLIDGRPPAGVLPRIAICPGSTLEVGRDSRVAVYLNEARTPLQLEESTRVRFQPPAEPGSGLVEMARGALYFLSEVRRTLTVRTPYVTAGVEGTEVYLRVDEPEAAAELIVLEGRVAVAPAPRNPTLEPLTATTGERVEVARGGAVARTSLPSDGTPFGALRRVTVGQLAWTLFYPDVLAGTEAQGLPRITEAARLLAAGQVAEAEAVLANVPEGGREAGLRDALRATIAFARKDAGEAQRLADRAIALAPDAASPRLAASYARQLALDLDGAVAAVEAAVAAAPQAPLPQARVAELRLMRGEIRAARRAAAQARALGGGPLAEIVLGYAELAALRGRAAEDAFLRALAQESRNPLALLGLGLAEIKQGRLEDGTQQIESAVVHDPSSSLLRSYLGKAYFEDRRDASAGTQLAIAKDLDPSDPTPWFYDAIRKQLKNRPVEALRDLGRSIDLNDNRAPFRSRLLLDQDRAVRGAALARIYEDLGFRQLGVNEARRSLMVDPASSAAHRFLADIYQGEPRLEVARVSELLQAQLLQPPGLNPIQPSLAFTDLNVIGAAGPARVSFNEFAPLFQRDGWKIVGTGILGTQNTYADEVTATTLLGRASLGLGQFLYDTDGFRQNDQLQHKIYTLFAQAAVTQDLDLQAEYRRRETNLGARSLDFDLEQSEPSRRESIDQDIFRLGGRLQLSPTTTLLVSGLYSNRNERVGTADSIDLGGGSVQGLEFRDRGDGTGKQIEAQTISDFGQTSIVAGAGVYRVDNLFQTVQTTSINDLVIGSDELFSDPNANVDARNLYLYTFSQWPEPVIWTMGLGYEVLDVQRRRQSELTPKLGVEYRATDRVTLRAAAFRTVKRELVAQQTIEPTTVAGFNQLYDDLNGTKANQLAAGLDIQLTPDLAVGVEAVHRRLAPPRFDDGDGDDLDVLLRDARESTIGGYAYLTATERVAVTAEVRGSRFRQHKDEAGSTPGEIDTILMPLSIRYFDAGGFFAVAGVSYINQSVTRQDDNSGSNDKWNDAWLLDASIGYRLPNRRGLASLELNNLLNKRFRWQDDTFRSSEQQNRRFLPERSAIVRISLNF